MKLKSMVRKIGAISTGVAFLGATITGALAADLANYPAPFADATAKKYDYTIVVGDEGVAAASDTIAAININSGLEGVPVAGVSGEGVEEDIPLGSNVVATNQLDTTLQDDDIPTLFDGKITFQSKEYDTSEEIAFSRSKNVTLQTSLSSSDDDYLTDVRMEIGGSGALAYFYAFDKAINISKTTSSDALKVKFLGKTLKITSVDPAQNKFTANVGLEASLKVGESVTDSATGKTLTLKNVGSSGSVLVDVDGVQETIDTSGTETVNGLEVKNDETFYDANNVDQRMATMVYGKDAASTYTDGDEYLEVDSVCNNDPKDTDCWSWVIANLGKDTTTTVNWSTIQTPDGPTIAIKNDFTMDDDSDNPPGVGECLTFPNDYVSVCIDSLTVPDTDYMTLEVKYKSGQDFSKAGGPSSQSAIYIYSSVSEGFKLRTSETGKWFTNGTAGTDGKKTAEIWLATSSLNITSYIGGLGNNTIDIDVYYKDTDGAIKYAGQINMSEPATVAAGITLAEVNYQDTKDTNIAIKLVGNWTNRIDTANTVNITFDIIGDQSADLTNNADDIGIQLRAAADGGNFTGFGETADTAEAQELYWGSSKTSIGTKDEDHRSLYGIIIRDPKNAFSSDSGGIKFEIPADQVQGNIKVVGSATAGGANMKSEAGDAPTALTASQATTAGKNVITVGGPCVNKVTASFLGVTFPACVEASGLAADEAIIELKDNGGKVAMVVAGWEATDTTRASLALKNYNSYKTDLKGTKVKVSGTGSTVGGITA